MAPDRRQLLLRRRRSPAERMPDAILEAGNVPTTTEDACSRQRARL
jgi:hypothetical protein